MRARYTYGMRTFLWVVVGVNQIFLTVIFALRLTQYEMSDFALHQEFGHKADTYSKLRRRLHKLLPEVRVWRALKLTILAVLQVSLLIHLTNPWLGIGLSLLVLAGVVVVARPAFVGRLANRLFIRCLEQILNFVQALHPLWAVFGIPERTTLLLPSSPDELSDQLRQLPSTVVSPVQRQRLESVLASTHKVTKDIMTPKKRVVSVEPTATLGPIVLSDLQKSGHGYFPVATKKGEPEGILTLSDVADIHAAKQRTTVRDLMSEQIAWVEEETSLNELIQAFLQEKQYLILVRNSDGNFSGLVTIADLMQHLLGIAKE